MKSIAYYISGHGYGHAVRSAEVVRVLVENHPEHLVHIRTSAPRPLFQGLPSANVHVHAADIDSGAVEQDGSLRIDYAKTVARLKRFMAASPALIDAEVEFIQQENVELLVADVPFLAGFVAKQSGVPCLAIANFTWDWIFEPMLADDPGGDECLAPIRAGYGHMTELLRLPFGHETTIFPRVTDVPLVATRAAKSRRDILTALGIDRHDQRRRVLVARRGGFSRAPLIAAAAAGPEFLFLHLGDVAGDLPDNVQAIPRSAGIAFNDLLNVSDTLISKLGFSTVAACIAIRTNLLFPPRVGFREDEIVGVEVQRLLNAREVTVAEFESGQWVDGLRAMNKAEPPSHITRIDGAAVCAKIIAKYADGRG